MAVASLSPAFTAEILSGRGAREDRGHARWLRGSGSLAPSVNRRITMTVGAISTTDRRATTRPCNLSPLGTQPASLRGALPSSRGQMDHPTGQVHCGEVLVLSPQRSCAVAGLVQTADTRAGSAGL